VRDVRVDRPRATHVQVAVGFRRLDQGRRAGLIQSASHAVQVQRVARRIDDVISTPGIGRGVVRAVSVGLGIPAVGVVEVASTFFVERSSYLLISHPDSERVKPKGRWPAEPLGESGHVARARPRLH